MNLLQRKYVEGIVYGFILGVLACALAFLTFILSKGGVR
jgi:hypothetical protein